MGSEARISFRPGKLASVASGKDAYKIGTSRQAIFHSLSLPFKKRSVSDCNNCARRSSFGDLPWGEQVIDEFVTIFEAA